MTACLMNERESYCTILIQEMDEVNGIILYKALAPI